jgi:hypothetical protein
LAIELCQTARGLIVDEREWRARKLRLIVERIATSPVRPHPFEGALPIVMPLVNPPASAAQAARRCSCGEPMTRRASFPGIDEPDRYFSVFSCVACDRLECVTDEASAPAHRAG